MSSSNYAVSSSRGLYTVSYLTHSAPHVDVWWSATSYGSGLLLRTRQTFVTTKAEQNQAVIIPDGKIPEFALSALLGTTVPLKLGTISAIQLQKGFLRMAQISARQVSGSPWKGFHWQINWASAAVTWPFLALMN